MTDKSASFFISDLHLGVDSTHSSLNREKIFIKWLESIEDRCHELYLVGDTFDYWFEYKNVIPKGYHRFLGKLALMVDKGTKVHLFAGNHDMWYKDYFSKELGFITHMDEFRCQIGEKKFYIAHGDGLGPGDLKYKVLKKIFRNKICQNIFSLVHPGIGLPIMKYLSQYSRIHNDDIHPENIQKEWLYIHSNQILKSDYYDFFIYGHRHNPIIHPLDNKHSIYVNLGDWLSYFTYGEFVNNNFTLNTFKR